MPAHLAVQHVISPATSAVLTSKWAGLPPMAMPVLFVALLTITAVVGVLAMLVYSWEAHASPVLKPVNPVLYLSLVIALATMLAYAMYQLQVSYANPPNLPGLADLLAFFTAVVTLFTTHGSQRGGAVASILRLIAAVAIIAIGCRVLSPDIDSSTVLAGTSGFLAGQEQNEIDTDLPQGLLSEFQRQQQFQHRRAHHVSVSGTAVSSAEEFPGGLFLYLVVHSLAHFVWFYMGFLVLLGLHTQMERFIAADYIRHIRSGRDPNSARLHPPSWLRFPSFGTIVVRMSRNRNFSTHPYLLALSRCVLLVALCVASAVCGFLLRLFVVRCVSGWWLALCDHLLLLPPEAFASGVASLSIQIRRAALSSVTDLLVLRFFWLLWQNLDTAKQQVRIADAETPVAVKEESEGGENGSPEESTEDNQSDCSACRICGDETFDTTAGGVARDAAAEIPVAAFGEALHCLVRPCRCSGSIALAHQVCLQRWLRHSSRPMRCEVCHAPYTFLPLPLTLKCVSWAAAEALRRSVAVAGLIAIGMALFVLTYALGLAVPVVLESLLKGMSLGWQDPSTAMLQNARQVGMRWEMLRSRLDHTHATGFQQLRYGPLVYGFVLAAPLAAALAWHHSELLRRHRKWRGFLPLYHYELDGVLPYSLNGRSIRFVAAHSLTALTVMRLAYAFARYTTDAGGIVRRPSPLGFVALFLVTATLLAIAAAIVVEVAYWIMLPQPPPQPNQHGPQQADSLRPHIE